MKREPFKLLGSCLKETVETEKLDEGLLRVRVFNAWECVVYDLTSRYLTREQAATMTSGKFYKDKTLSCKITSSVVRNQLSMAKPQILRQMNKMLKGQYVNQIILN